MSVTVGISATGHVSIGLVDNHRLIASTHEDLTAEHPSMLTRPMENLVQELAWMIRALCVEYNVSPVAVGLGFPGIIRDGIVEESPNLKQAKGSRLGELLTRQMDQVGIPSHVTICNDADAIATGIAATRGHMEKFLRVWTLGQGIGFGRYPHPSGPFEGGHVVVSLDAKETYCGCGGVGHLEGIMGHRAMRLRFLDLEPEEVFAEAAAGDQRCANFELLWHRALAAASATSIHLEGPGRFYVTGPNARFAKVSLLTQFLQEMVSMSPLQGSVIEIIRASEDLAIIGAAVNAESAVNANSR